MPLTVREEELGTLLGLRDAPVKTVVYSRGVMIIFIGDLEGRTPYISVIQRWRWNQPQSLVSLHQRRNHKQLLFHNAEILLKVERIARISHGIR
jgi:hypothetical protein